MKDLSLSRRKKPKVKIVCSFNGTFLRRQPSGKLRYTGGETRIISVDRTVGFSRLKSKVWELIRCPNQRRRNFYLQYRISDTESTEQQSPLVLNLIASDDDVRCMIDAYEKLELYGKYYYRLWIYVCNDSEYVNLQNLQSIVLCESHVFDYRSYVKSEMLSLCDDNGFDGNNLAVKICGGELVCEKVKKEVKSGDKVKSRDDCLRKTVLRQQLLAKQSVLNESLSCGLGLGLAIEQAGREITSVKNDTCSDVGLSSEREADLICGPASPSFCGSSCRLNMVDHKYHYDIYMERRGCVDSVLLSTSQPLYPKDGNLGVGLNASNMALFDAGKTSDSDSSYSVDVLPFPKPYSMVSYYDAKCESGSVEPGAKSKLDKESIMPWAVGPTSSIGLVPGNGRKQRIYASHSRCNNNIITKIRNHKNVRLDKRPWMEKFYPGIQHGQIVKSSFPKLLKPRPESHDQLVEGDAVSSQCILYNPTSSFSFSCGSKENKTKQSELGFPQKGYTSLEHHLPYQGQHPSITDQFSLPLAGNGKFSGCTDVVGTQIDFLDSPNQHSVTNQQDVANISRSLNETVLGSNARLIETDVTCKSFSKKQSAAPNMQESVDTSVHNLSLLSLGDLQPSTYSTNGNIIKASGTPQSVAVNLMDQEQFGTGPHCQKIPCEAVPVLSSEKLMALHDGNKKVAVLQQDVKSALNTEDKKDIQKSSEKPQANGQIPKEIASVYNHLATGELQTIRNSDLEYIKELGSGTYGTVFYGKWKGSDVAIKRLKPGCFDGGAVEENRLVADFWKEAYILGQLRHPNIVALYGVVTDGPATNLATVTEYMVNGSLRQVFRRKDRTIDRRKRLIIAMDAAFGMEYLHEKNIVHFDLKSHNLLVNMRDPRRPVCKIGDLGLSKIKQKTLVSGGVRGTIPWMAPELLSCKSLVTEKIDVYSFGIVMWELLTGEEPYAKMRSHEIIAGIIKGTLRPEAPAWCDPAWRSLMEKCWSADPDTRPSFSEITQELRTMAEAMNIK